MSKGSKRRSKSGPRSVLVALDPSREVKVEPVFIPEWQGTVLIQALTPAQAAVAREFGHIWGRGGRPHARLQKLRAKMVALSVVDENGRLVFSPDDIEALSEKHCAALERILDVVRRMSGVSDERARQLVWKRLHKVRDVGR